MSKLRKGVVWVGVLLVVLELGLRYSGRGDFPVYRSDDQIGYIPAPSQSGALERVNDWALNDRSMLNDRSFTADPESGVLLIGDSLVWGWIKYPQMDKLGPQLGLKLGRPESVWSVGAGSWAVLNELVWLERNPDVVKGVKDIVWIVNSGDLGARSLWSNELIHPHKHPVWLTGYLIRKFLALRGWWPSSGLPLTRRGDIDSREALKQFCLKLRNASGPRLIFVYYPNLSELKAGLRSKIPAAEKLHDLAIEVGAEFYDLRDNKEWSDQYYRDGIHPSPEGNRKLASLLAEFLEARGNAGLQ